MSGITITVTTVLSLLGLGIAFYYMRKVTSVPVDMGLDEKDGERLRFIHGAIADGAMAFLKQEYKFLAIFMVVFAAIIAILIDDSTRRITARVSIPRSRFCSGQQSRLRPAISA